MFAAASATAWASALRGEAAYGVDAWSLRATIAVRTTRVTIGTLLTALPWRRPWKVASQVATVDRLQRPRRPYRRPRRGHERPAGHRRGDRAEREGEGLDEGLDLMRTLWGAEGATTGGTTTTAGELDELSAMGGPLRERIPIWVVGAWPRPKSMNRVLRCDGIVPQYEGFGDEARGTAVDGTTPARI